MSIEATSWALHQRCPTPTAKLVLLGLASHARADGSAAWPSVETLATYADATRRSVQRSLRALEEAGLISRSADQPDHLPSDRRTVAYDCHLAGRHSDAPSRERGDIHDVDGATSTTSRGDASVARTVHEPSKREPSPRPSTSDADAPDDDGEVTYPEEVYDLTREFATLVKDNGHTLPKRGSTAATGWLREMDRLRRIGPPGDGQEAPADEEIRSVMRWALSVSSFWPANVRSVPKFREQFTTLRAQRDRGSPGKAPPGPALAKGYSEAADEFRRRRGSG